MVSRLTGGTVRPGPGYNTGTLKSTLSGFTVGSHQDTDSANILSDASSSENSDDLPLPQPTRLTPQRLTPRPMSPPKPPLEPVVAKPVAMKKPVEQYKPVVDHSPFVSIKRPPALPSKAPVSKLSPPKPVQHIQQPAKKPVKAPEPVETDADCLSDASKSDLSLSELGDTTEQESDWPELDIQMSSIKPRAVTTPTNHLKPLEPKKLTLSNAVKPISPAISKASSSRVLSMSRALESESVKQSDAEIVTDYDDLSDTDLTLGDTTDAETTTTTTNNNTTMVRPAIEIGRQESMRSEMTDSDWDFEATAIKPTAVRSITPQQLLKPTIPKGLFY